MKKNKIIIRSSAAEYLTFVATIGDSSESIEMRYEDENIWLTQKLMATLYDVTISALYQYIMFQDYDKPREELEDTVDYKYLKEIIEVLRKEEN